MDGENDSVHSVPKTSTMDNEKEPNKKDEDWRSYSKDLAQRLLLEGVRDATASRNKERLHTRLKECEQHGLADHKDVKRGKFVFSVIEQKDKLYEAINGNTVRPIRDEIDEIESNRSVEFKRELQQDVITANTRIDEIKRGKKPRKNILAMDKKTMSEVRRYHNPPAMMKRIIQAALLLMGEDEHTTSDWGNCLKLLNPQGKGGMSRKVMEFDAKSIHPEISATSKYILTEELYDTRRGERVQILLYMDKSYNPDETYKDKYWTPYDLTKIQSVSPAAATFYVWAMGIIDDCEKHQEEQDDSDSSADIPASIKRQWEIFGRHKKPTEAPKLSPYARRKFHNNDRFLQRESQGNVSYRSDVQVSPVNHDI